MGGKPYTPPPGLTGAEIVARQEEIRRQVLAELQADPEYQLKVRVVVALERLADVSAESLALQRESMALMRVEAARRGILGAKRELKVKPRAKPKG